ncbi:MAG: DUF3667 domain-containing protein [Pseudomonadota bacterium]|nr:DUF3667 domain-containing protein [Pseudomonadota bacterium]
MTSRLCPNCNNPTQGNFCCHCGQRANNPQKALWPLLSEVAEETFEVDGRLIRTIKLLFSKPGFLAAEFSANRRARYLSPFRLYLFSSLLFFFLAQVFTDGFSQEIRISQDGDPTAQAIVISDPITNQFKSMVSPELHYQVDTVLSRDTAAANVLKEVIVIATEEQGFLSKQSATAQFIRDQIVIILYDPNELAQGFLQNVPLAMVFLLPAFALLVKLIFRRPHRYFVEHLVFALHVHSTAFLMFMLLTPIPQSMDQTPVGDVVETGFYLAFSVHGYLALRRYYDYSPGHTLFRYALLLLAYWAAMIPTLLSIGLITFITL